VPGTRVRDIRRSQSRCGGILAAITCKVREYRRHLGLAQARLRRHDAAIADAADLQITHEARGDDHHQVIASLRCFRKRNNLFVQRRKAAGYAGRFRSVAHRTTAGENARAGYRFVRMARQRKTRRCQRNQCQTSGSRRLLRSAGTGTTFDQSQHPG